MIDARYRNHTKKGPGRYHGQGKLIVVRPFLTDVYLTKQPERRLKPAIHGGNHVGAEYLTYAEHDECTRHTFNAKSKASKRAMYDMARTMVTQRRDLSQAS
jgi:hypothetical protein